MPVLLLETLVCLDVTAEGLTVDAVLLVDDFFVVLADNVPVVGFEGKQEPFPW